MDTKLRGFDRAERNRLTEQMDRLWCAVRDLSSSVENDPAIPFNVARRIVSVIDASNAIPHSRLNDLIQATPVSDGDGGDGGASPPSAASSNAPECGACGAVMVRSGEVFKCLSCGSTTGAT